MFLFLHHPAMNYYRIITCMSWLITDIYRHSFKPWEQYQSLIIGQHFTACQTGCESWTRRGPSCWQKVQRKPGQYTPCISGAQTACQLQTKVSNQLLSDWLKADFDALGANSFGSARILLLPTVIINTNQYRGRLDTPSIVRALCAGFSESTEPEVGITTPYLPQKMYLAIYSGNSLHFSIKIMLLQRCDEIIFRDESIIVQPYHLHS